MAEVIRPCTEQGPGEILEVINYAAQAYKGVIGGSPRQCLELLGDVLHPGQVTFVHADCAERGRREKNPRVVKLRSDGARVEFGAPPG